MKRISTLIIFTIITVVAMAQNSYKDTFRKTNIEHFFSFNVGYGYSHGKCNDIHSQYLIESALPSDYNGNYNHSRSTDCRESISTGTIAMSLTLFGVYFDGTFALPRHSQDIRVSKWNDENKVLTLHVGYQIPITYHIRVIPIVGWSKMENGNTDGYNWSCNSAGIHNKFNAEHSHKTVDFGGIVRFNTNKGIVSCNIDLIATKTFVGATVGIELGKN